MLPSPRAAIALWLTAAAFVVMGAFKIDAVGPNRIASVHGALHTISFFTLAPLGCARTRRRRPRRAGIAGAIMFRAWTHVLVAWVVLAARELGGNATP
jgi:hypothetical protein